MEAELPSPRDSGSGKGAVPSGRVRGGGFSAMAAPRGSGTRSHQRAPTCHGDREGREGVYIRPAGTKLQASSLLALGVLALSLLRQHVS